MKKITRLVQAAQAFDTASGGVVVPVQPATTFLRGADNQPLNPANTYARDHNDTVRLVEQLITELEGGAASLLFPSGMAAIAALFRTLPTGARIVLQQGIYWGTTNWVRSFAQRRGMDLAEVEMTDPAAVVQALQGAALLWIETPSNPMLRVIDIAAVAQMAHQAGALLAVDNTAATPLLTNPLTLGADVVMNSATKAMNGHSDVLAGSLTFAQDNTLYQAVQFDRAEAGAIIGPFEAWLLLRGLRSFALRVERMCQNAQKIADALAAHPNVPAVFYPGLADHPGHDVAANQMQGGFGYLLSFLAGDTRAQSLQVIGDLQVFHRATSMGGVESLVEHRHTIEPYSNIPENLLRLSIGIEDVDDLIDDLTQALDRL